MADVGLCPLAEARARVGVVGVGEAITVVGLAARHASTRSLVTWLDVAPV
jgi:hypothetical protein